jgi:hypothetical protein
MWREDEEEDVSSCLFTLRKTRGNCKLKEKALDRILRRTRCGRGCGPVIIIIIIIIIIYQIQFSLGEVVLTLAQTLTVVHTGRKQNE